MNGNADVAANFLPSKIIKVSIIIKHHRINLYSSLHVVYLADAIIFLCKKYERKVSTLKGRFTIGI